MLRAVRRAILLFLKWPEPGRVKTRLAAALGAQEAAEAYRALVAEVCRRLPAEPDLVVMCDPPERTCEIAVWVRGLVAPRSVAFLPQAAGDLGARLMHAFEVAFAQGYDMAAAIGSDCVELTCAHFEEAWRELETADGVIGPTFDGGYYLLA